MGAITQIGSPEAKTMGPEAKTMGTTTQIESPEAQTMGAIVHPEVTQILGDFN